MGGGSPKVVHTLGGGLAKGVLGVYMGGGWVKKGLKSAYVICTQPHAAQFTEVILSGFQVVKTHKTSYLLKLP